MIDESDDILRTKNEAKGEKVPLQLSILLIQEAGLDEGLAGMMAPLDKRNSK